MTDHQALPATTLSAALASTALALLLLVAGAPDASAQETRHMLGGRPAAEVARFGAVLVVEADGPPLIGRREFYRPVPPLDIRSRWIVVQDSTFGVVFTQPSGVKSDLEVLDSDLYLRALEDIKAVEVRSLAFNVWGEMSAYLGVTVLMERTMGERWDLHPRWLVDDLPLHEHRTSVTWVHRVMFEDESVLQADVEPLAAAWSHVTGAAFEGLPEEQLLRAVGP